MTQNHDSKIRNQVTLLHKYEGILLFCLDEGSYLVYFFKKVKRKLFCGHGLDGVWDVLMVPMVRAMSNSFMLALCLKTAHVPLKKTA